MVAHRTHSPGGPPPATRTGELARDADVVGAEVEVADLEELFRRDRITSVVVEDPDRARTGVITRPRFNSALTGRLGYGRAVLLRRPLSMITDWSPLVVTSHDSVADVATRAMARVGERRYDDVLVRGEHWQVAEAADLMVALVAALARATTHDPLTGLPPRAAAWHELGRRCGLAAGGRARVVLVLVAVAGLGQINERHGDAEGDLVLTAFAHQLTAAVPPGCDLGRIDGDTFAVVGTMPPCDDVRAARGAYGLRDHVTASVGRPPAGYTGRVWPAARATVVWSVAQAAEADALARAAQARLARTRELVAAAADVQAPASTQGARLPVRGT